VPPGGRYCSYCGAPVKPGWWRPLLRLFSVVGLAGLLLLASFQVYNGLKREYRDSSKAAARTTEPTTTTSVVTTTAAPAATVAPATAAPATPAPTAPPASTVLAKTVVKATSIVAPAPTPPAPDACQQMDNFEVANLQDGDFATAYRVKGSGVGRQIRLRLAAPTRITEVGLVPGWAKVGCDGADLFRQHRTVARVRWTFDGGKSVEQAFNAAPDLQVLAVDVVSTNVTVRILATNPPNGINMTAVSEIRLSGVASA
jgi:hypothetical protein